MQNRTTWLERIWQAAEAAARQGTGRGLAPLTRRLCEPYANRIAGDARLRREALDLLEQGLRFGRGADCRLIALAMAAVVQFGTAGRNRTRVVRLGLDLSVVSGVVQEGPAADPLTTWAFAAWVRRTAHRLLGEPWTGRLVEDVPAAATAERDSVA